MMSDDLKTLGYPEPGGVARFQRHAKRTYRKTANGEPVEETPVYNGPEDGAAGQTTLDEIARWLQKGFRRPIGFYKLTKIAAWGSLREDAAAAWLEVMAGISELGGTIDGPYGDTKRPLMNTISVGASKFSDYICGRAVDLNQGQTRYYVKQEPQGLRMMWRIYCKTADQTGVQGRKFEPGAVACYSFAAHKDYPLPAGYYIDLTAEIERGGLFTRIHSQAGWEQETRKSEWWHYQWIPEPQKSFQDECELIGITEAQLRGAGYTDADLNHLPG